MGGEIKNMSRNVNYNSKQTDTKLRSDLRIRMTISMAMSVDIAARTLNTKNRVNDARYIVLRPRVSENEDHQSGKMDMESIYRAAERLVMVGEVCRSSEICSREAGTG